MFTMGTVKLSSAKSRCYFSRTSGWCSASPRQLTRLSDEQKEPHAAGEVDQERNGVSRILEEVYYSEKCAVTLRLQPAGLDVAPFKNGPRRRVVVPGRPSNEGRGEAPC